MHQMSDIRKWAIWLVLMSSAVVASYAWLDRPIATLVHDHLQRFDLFAKLTYIPEVLSPLVIIAFAVIGLRALSGRPLSKPPTVTALAAASLAVTAAVKDQLNAA